MTMYLSTILFEISFFFSSFYEICMLFVLYGIMNNKLSMVETVELCNVFFNVLAMATFIRLHKGKQHVMTERETSKCKK